MAKAARDPIKQRGAQGPPQPQTLEKSKTLKALEPKLRLFLRGRRWALRIRSGTARPARATCSGRSGLTGLGGGFKAFWGLSRFEILRFREFCAQGGFRDFRGFGFYSIF